MNNAIVKISAAPEAKQNEMAAQIVDWGHSEYIASKAIDDIWYDVYLYTEVIDGELVAIGTAVVDDRGFLEILNLATKWARRGVGCRAVEALKALAVELETEITLMAAVDVVKFWEKMGLEIDDCFFGDEEDGVLMWQS